MPVQCLSIARFGKNLDQKTVIRLLPLIALAFPLLRIMTGISIRVPVGGTISVLFPACLSSSGAFL